MLADIAWWVLIGMTAIYSETAIFLLPCANHGQNEGKNGIGNL